MDQFEFFEFLEFIISQNEALPYATGFVMSVVFMIIIGIIMFYLNYRDPMVSSNMEEPIMVYKYSNQGSLYVYDDYCRINRSGTFISDYLCNVIDVTCSKDSKDRIISVVYGDNENPKTEVIHCGRMDVFEFLKIKDLIMKYTGGY